MLTFPRNLTHGYRERGGARPFHMEYVGDARAGGGCSQVRTRSGARLYAHWARGAAGSGAAGDSEERQRLLRVAQVREQMERAHAGRRGKEWGQQQCGTREA